ncbi:MAG: hypothetical protein LWY06_18115 [Firmicutes bacterium]|nr:hypothetical protein [Bacillota bacterium]
MKLNSERTRDYCSFCFVFMPETASEQSFIKPAMSETGLFTADPVFKVVPVRYFSIKLNAFR